MHKLVYVRVKVQILVKDYTQVSCEGFNIGGRCRIFKSKKKLSGPISRTLALSEFSICRKWLHIPVCREYGRGLKTQPWGATVLRIRVKDPHAQ